ncbi:MAG: ferrous iron transporter B [Deltaproteobacteria bacterium]|nr:ferrous iron transporter B [Deltaproteobacteria bacterium]
MKILLLGNPNVGKSVIFNRLTSSTVITSNYPGTTVEFTRGSMLVGGKRAEVIDVPGTYSLKASSAAEETAVKMLQEGDVILNVVDSTNLERSLNLTLQLIKRQTPMLIALNLWDEAGHTGVNIDIGKLEKILDLPCIPTVAVTGQGIKDLVLRVPDARTSSYDYDEAERWHDVGNIVEQVQTITHRHHTFLETLGDASIRPRTGIPICIMVLLMMFEIIRYIGEGLITFVLDPFFESIWGPVVLRLSGLLGGEGFLHDLLVGKLTEGSINFGESFGLLTTGLYVPLAAVLPYVFAFYIVLSFLEDSGYLPRLAVLMDTLMHRLGMHGMSIIPMLLGLGCNVPGALATRIIESKRQRFIAATLMAVAVPCMAQLSMVVALAGDHGASALLIIFGSLFIVWVALGYVLNRVLGGESTEILIDIPPYRIPYFPGLVKKIWMRLIWFVREAVPWVLFGVLIINVLYITGIIAFLAKLTQPIVKGLLGLPPEAVGALVVGFLRKDVAVGMLKPLGLSFTQVIVASVVLTMYFPCVATFTVLLKEFGVLDMLRAAGIMVISALFVGTVLNLILTVL